MGKVPGAAVAKGEANYNRGPGARIGGDMWATDPEKSGYGKATADRKRTNHMFAGPDYSIIHPGLFPHSKAIRDQLWDMQNQVLKDNGDIEVKERANLRHVINFNWEDGWGDATSAFEKRVAKNPKLGEAIPWPWNDLQVPHRFPRLTQQPVPPAQCDQHGASPGAPPRLPTRSVQGHQKR